MPIETDERLKVLLAQGRITAVTLDTSIFDAQKLNLNSPVFKAIVNLRDLPFQFLLTGTVLKEVEGHLAKSMEDALGAVKKAIGSALYAFDTAKPTRDELLDCITGRMTPADSAATRLGAFVENSNCKVLDDSSLVDVTTLFDAYFASRPPFSRGKKAEFPDALALHALEQEAAQRHTGFLVVSEDSDWRAFCEKSQVLYLIPKVEKALSLLNSEPLRLRRAVVEWLSQDHDGRAEVSSAISSLIENFDVDASAHASSGEVELHAWVLEAHSIGWPDENDIDIIETEELGERHYRAVVSLPVLVSVRVNIDIDFSIWDSVDKESISMGSRSTESERKEEVRVTVTIDLESMGNANESIELLETELDIQSLDVDLGEIDFFDMDNTRYD